MPVTAGTHKQKIIEALDLALQDAELETPISLPEEVSAWISTFSLQIDNQATSAFNNIVTCLAACASEPSCDPRYHRPPSEEMPAPENGKTHFTGRGISEGVIYPWLAKNGFRGSMSGWQTRVFERERPYTLDYRENISRVKTEFLGILDAVANGKAKASYVLSEFFRLEIEEKQKRESSLDWLAKHPANKSVSILQIVEALERHFESPRSARLPVLAIQAVYMTMMPFISRYRDMSLSPLSEHSAADENTGAIGDIEVIDSDDDVFEGVEVKHGVIIDDTIVRRACEKVEVSTASRYYVLSTSQKTTVTEVGRNLILELQKKHGCQMVVNGVLPTIKYYLRLLDEPADFLNNYQKLLASDRRVTREQTDSWRNIAKFFQK